MSAGRHDVPVQTTVSKAAPECLPFPLSLVCVAEDVLHTHGWRIPPLCWLHDQWLVEWLLRKPSIRGL